ncbi:MAG: N-acetyltransferase [Bacteroidota bacterium]
MKPEYLNVPLVKNDEKKRFGINVDGYFAFINFGEFGNHIALVHTETEPELAGKGAAAAVVEKTLQYIEDNGKLLMPYCPYVFAYIKRHPEWKRIVSSGFHGYREL